MPIQIDTASYKENGFLLTRGALSDLDFAPLVARFLELASARTGETYSKIDDPELIAKISSDRDLEMYLYDSIRRYPELVEFSLAEILTCTISKLLGGRDNVLLEKIPFRIDCPMVIRELAVWHQDHFYVKGDPETVTAWIPLQDTSFREGCLMIMPGSHSNGPITHDTTILQKKIYPSDIFDREVRYVEMKRGDVLFFHGCLLHSSGNNISDVIRYSVQARYLATSHESDPGMGKRIAIS